MDTTSLLESVGYAGIFISVFIECGVPLGLILPLPGYSLLFAGGVFAASGHMDFWAIIAVGITAAVLGYIVGYFSGYKYGRKLFYESKTKKYFTPEQGKKTEKFMKRFGYLTLVVGRFVAILHNLAPIMSGVARTPFLKFMIANVFGAVIWVFSAVLLGFYVGQSVPNAHLYVIPLIIAIIIFINSPLGRAFALKVSRMMDKL